jgi:hypothetical protein
LARRTVVRKILIRHSDGAIQAGADLASMGVALKDARSFVWVDMEGEPPNALQERKIVSPQREVFNALSRRDSLLIGSQAAVYFGMNFTSIPYDRPWLFATLLLVMLGLPIAMVIVFARRGWIAAHRRTTRRSRLWSWLRLRRHER